MDPQKLTAIEIQMMIDEINKMGTFQLGIVEPLSKVIIEYYKIYKSSGEVESSDVVKLAVLSGLKQHGLGG